MSGSDGTKGSIPGWLSQLFNSEGANCGPNNVPMMMNQLQIQMMLAGYGSYGINNQYNQPGQPLNNEIQTNTPSFPQQSSQSQFMQSSNGLSVPPPVNKPFVPPMNGPPPPINGPPFMSLMNVPPPNLQPMVAPPMNVPPPNLQPVVAPPMNVPPPNLQTIVAPPMNVPPPNLQPIAASQINVPPPNLQPIVASSINVPPPNLQPVVASPMNGPTMGANPQFAQPMHCPPMSANPQFAQTMNSSPMTIIPQFGQPINGPPMNVTPQVGQLVNAPQLEQMNRPPNGQTGMQLQPQSENMEGKLDNKPQISSGGDVSKKNENEDTNDNTFKVFVGNINAKVPDAMIVKAVMACGDIVQWHRFSTFGFCEFASPEGAQRCVRLLHDRNFADKKLTAKADQKSGKVAKQPVPRSRRLDDEAEKKLRSLEIEFREEIEQYEARQKEKVLSKIAKALEEAEMPKEVFDLVQREIGKFREDTKEEKVMPGRRLDDARARLRSQMAKPDVREAVDRCQQGPTQARTVEKNVPLNKPVSLQPAPKKQCQQVTSQPRQSHQPQKPSSDQSQNNLRNSAHSYVEQILNLPNVNKISSLRDQFLKPLVSSLDALKQVGLPVDEWSFILYHVVSSKLSSDLNDRFKDDYIGNNANYLPPFEDLLTFLNEECSAADEISKAGEGGMANMDIAGGNDTDDEYASDDVMIIADSPEPDNWSVIEDVTIVQDSPKKSHVQNNNKQKDMKDKNSCLFCRQPHSMKNCPHFKKLPSSDRYKFAKKRKLCFGCLGQHVNCNRFVEPCSLCRGRHLSIFCQLGN